MIDHLLASLMTLTRLPFWRLKQVPAESFKHVTPYWHIAGVFTGGGMALTFWVAHLILPLHISVLLAIIARLLITGALHEDGLADFCDGMGGGRDRQHTLAIMKDSHIGSYGVIGLILYFLVLFHAMSFLAGATLPLIILSGDILSKYIASNIVEFLPYARKEAESKLGVAYERKNLAEHLIGIAVAAFPIGYLCYVASHPIALLLPLLLFFVLIGYMKKKIQGYTGDCCGALALLLELTIYLSLLIP